jgi:hypothetical protein
MTDKQLYTLCGVITFSAAVLANSPFLGMYACFWFVSALWTNQKQ